MRSQEELFGEGMTMKALLRVLDHAFLRVRPGTLGALFARGAVAAALALFAIGAQAANAAEPLLLRASDLPQWLDRPGVIVIDARGDREDFEKHHLRGARFLDWDRWSRELAAASEGSPEALGRSIRGLGLRPDSTILIYDYVRMGWSANVWLGLAHSGFEHVHLVTTPFARLDQVLPPDRFESGPAANVAPGSAGEFHRDGAAPEVVGREEILALLKRGAPRLFDNRSLAEFDGADSAAEAGIRPGHIPKALLLPDRLFFDASGEPLPPEGLRAMLRAYGPDEANGTTLYCRAAGRAAAVAALLADAGLPKVRVFAGSWLEWGADPALPVEHR